MKIFTYDLSDQIEMTDEQYDNFTDDLQRKGLLKEYLRRLYLEMIARHKASLPEWNYGKPMFVRMNRNGIISVFYETFDEFFYMVAEDGSVRWCRKEQCREVFPEYFAKLRAAGIPEEHREQIDRPFSYFENN